jgi:23S rRNA (uracil1939-C5)-methyltransferase
VVSLDAEKLIGGGRCLAHHEGATWMIAGALPEEVVAVQPLRRRAGVVEGKTLEVVGNPHPSRLAEPCPHAAHCGGCDWPHVDPVTGAALKASVAAEAARTFPDIAGRLSNAVIHRSPLGYRLRARLHWDPERNVLGFYDHKSWSVTAIPSCRILSPQLMSALPVLSAALKERCPAQIDIEWIEGSDSGDAVAALRRARNGPQRYEPVWVPTQSEVGTVVRGFHILSGSGLPRAGWGEEEVTIRLTTDLRVPIGSFFQGNRHLLAPLFDRVAELAGPATKPVFDLHAGVGFLAAAAQSAGERPLNLAEPHRPAALAARRNIPKAQVAVGQTAEAFLARAGNLPSDSLAITDPPRAGMTRALRSQIADWNPCRILMLGCDPATWARDAAFLCERGYHPTALELFDLFPSTHHVEILALLESG